MKRRRFLAAITAFFSAPVKAIAKIDTPNDDVMDIHTDTFQHVQGPWRKDGPFKRPTLPE